MTIADCRLPLLRRAVETGFATDLRVCMLTLSGVRPALVGIEAMRIF